MISEYEVLKLINKLAKERDNQPRGSAGYYERNFAISQLNIVVGVI